MNERETPNIKFIYTLQQIIILLFGGFCQRIRTRPLRSSATKLIRMHLTRHESGLFLSNGE